MKIYCWTCTFTPVLPLAQSPLEICLPTFLLVLIEILLFLFFPQFHSLFFLTFSLAIKQTLLLLLFFLIFLLVNLMQSHLPSEIHTSSFYSRILLPYIIIPINKIGCFLLLFLYHSFIRFGSSSFCFVEDSNSCRHS